MRKENQWRDPVVLFLNIRMSLVICGLTRATMEVSRYSTFWRKIVFINDGASSTLLATHSRHRDKTLKSYARKNMGVGNGL